MADLEEYLHQWLASFEPGSQLKSLRPLGGGISSGMMAFTISGPKADRTLILRQPNDWTLANIPRAVGAESDRLGALHDEGIPVPLPVFADETTASFGRPGLVIEYVEGKVDLRPRDLATYLDQFARHLAAIHQVDPSTPGICVHAPPGLERFRQEAPPQAEAVYQVERIWAALRTHATTQSTNRPVLLHGDYWPGNTLWRQDRLVAVIDWEAAELEDPLKDLAIARIDLWWLFGPQAAADFTTAYVQQHAIDISLLPLWDLETSLRLIDRPQDWAASHAPLGRPDITLDCLQRGHAGFVEQAFGALSS